MSSPIPDQPYTGPTQVLPTQPPVLAKHRIPRQPSGVPPRPPLHPPRGPRRRWFRWVMIALALSVILSCIALLVLQQVVAGKVVVADHRANRPSGKTLTSPMNVLLLGIDLRAGHPEEGVRSDTLQMLHLDPGAGWASLLAIPRDSLAIIPDEGEAKINRGFAHGYEVTAGTVNERVAGGMASAADTVERFLQLPAAGQRIDYIATVNFDGFAAIVDALGGVDIDVPYRIEDDSYPTPDFGTQTLIIEAGPQHMNGNRALQYVRTRHADSDFGRGERQQQVLRAMSTALRSKPVVFRPFVALRTLNAASGAIQTTLPVGRIDALLLALQLARFDPAAIVQHRLSPETVAVTEEGSDLRWDRAGLEELVSTLLSPPGEAQEQAQVAVVNGTTTQGLAARVTTTLAEAQFTVAQPGDHPPTDRSQIIVYHTKPLTLRRLQQQLRGIPVVTGASDTAPAGADLVVVLGADYERFVTP